MTKCETKTEKPGDGERVRSLWLACKDCICDAVVNYETIFINFHLLDKEESTFVVVFLVFRFCASPKIA